MSKIFNPALKARQPLAASVLEAAALKGRLAHAYLFTGRALTDKWLLARELACHLNCLERAGECGSRCGSATTGASLTDRTICQNCRWISAGQHPQAFLTLSGEGTKTGKVAVEKARQLAAELSKTSAFIRVVVIPDASEEILHRPAANALLKTIEEPGAGCLFLLFSRYAEEVLPTIVSRCQLVPVNAVVELGLNFEGEADEELLQKMEAARHKTEELTAVTFALSPGKAKRGDLLAALDWAGELCALSESLPAGLLIDLAAKAQFQANRKAALADKNIFSRLWAMLEAAGKASAQIDHFVGPRAAIEALALSWFKIQSGRFPANPRCDMARSALGKPAAADKEI